MHQAKVGAEVTLVYFAPKSGRIHYKAKCAKNAGIRLVVPKNVEHT